MKNKNRPVYSIIVPAYREEQVISNSLQELNSYLKSERLLNETEVIVVAANGNDKTAQIAKTFTDSFTHLSVIEPGPKSGKGRDVRIGILASVGNYVLFTDADMATPVKYIKPLFNQLRSGADMVIGERDLTKIHTGYRSIISRLANKLTRMIVLPGFSDTQCGFKGFKHDAAQLVFGLQQINGWGFDIEILSIANKYHLKVECIEISDWHDPKIENGLAGESSFHAAYKTFGELLKIKLNMLRGLYDKD